MTTSRRNRWYAALAVVAIAALGILWISYDRLRRERPQPEWILPRSGQGFGDTQFKYLSLGSEENGISYWIFYVLPMMFPEKLPGIGGYGSFGLPWEFGVELRIGMT